MSSSSTLSLDNLTPNSEQLCYVHCNICDTVLVVSVPCSSLFKTVTVRCGHCTNFLPVNLRGLLLPSPNQIHSSHGFSSASRNFADQQMNPTPNFLMKQNSSAGFNLTAETEIYNLPDAPFINRSSQKRQRIPSAYNRFIKEEIRRIKGENPEISHREAFSAAAKNWAHFPHIQFGLVPDLTANKTTLLQRKEKMV